MELIKEFWKYAGNINKTDNIENVFIKWAEKEKISTEEFNILYTEIDNQIKSMFKKGEISIKENGQTLTFDNVQEYKDFINSNSSEQNTPINQPAAEQKQEQPISDINSANSPNNVENNTSNGIAQQPIENKENIGQEKSAISPEPNAAINENVDMNNSGDTADKEKQELKEGLLSILKK
jgi:hypothetical protein